MWSRVCAEEQNGICWNKCQAEDWFELSWHDWWRTSLETDNQSFTRDCKDGCFFPHVLNAPLLFWVDEKTVEYVDNRKACHPASFTNCSQYIKQTDGVTFPHPCRIQPQAKRFEWAWSLESYRVPILFTGVLSFWKISFPLILITTLSYFQWPCISFCHMEFPPKWLDLHRLMSSFEREIEIVFSLHQLIHLANKFKYFGPLDNESGFPVDNYPGQIKHHLSKLNEPLLPVVKRFSETPHVHLEDCCCSG